jgi:hypothetical protein
MLIDDLKIGTVIHSMAKARRQIVLPRNLLRASVSALEIDRDAGV